ncbi:MAG: adenosylcobinamide-phosphate synthase CbiB [Dehalococcoidia bacterium]
MSTAAFVLGVALDAAGGDPPTRVHPVGLVGASARVLRRRAPTTEASRRRYGWAVALGLPLASAFAAGTLRAAAARRSRLLGLLVEAGLLSLMSSSHALLGRASEVEAALAADDLDGARALLATHLVSRDTSGLDASEVAAATIESVAENLSDGVVAPWVAYAVGGLPLAAAYRSANTLDALWGYRTAELEALGQGAARIDDALNLVPARLTAVALALAVATKGGLRRSWRTWRRDRGRTASPNAGHPMSAMAGALGVRLEKRDAYVLGAEFAAPEPADLRRALRLARRAMLGAAAALAGLQFCSSVGKARP